MAKSVKNELAAWSNRVIFDVKFKENTAADLSVLEYIYNRSISSFCSIAANSESLVYKIARHFIVLGSANKDFTFVDGKIVEAYIGDQNEPEWKKKERVDDFFESYSKDFKLKWVLIPEINFSFSLPISIYFMNKMKHSGAMGLIYFSGGPNNLAEVLHLNVTDPDLFEFPKVKYMKKKHQLIDDEY